MPTAVLSPVAGPYATAAPVQRVALIGNPNTGKTTLFNALCGARAKTSNFPGTTTSARPFLIGSRLDPASGFSTWGAGTAP